LPLAHRAEEIQIDVSSLQIIHPYPALLPSLLQGRRNLRKDPPSFVHLRISVIALVFFSVSYDFSPFPHVIITSTCSSLVLAEKQSSPFSPTSFI